MAIIQSGTNKTNIMLPLLFVLVCLLQFSFCKKQIYVDEENCENYDYENCNTTEPQYGNLKIKVTINSRNPKVPIIVFNGYYDNKDTLLLDTVSILNYTLQLEGHRYFSVLAKYNTKNGIIYTLDAGEPRKRKQDVCDSVCWWNDEAVIDLRILSN
jgi:hypothetical protein